MADDVKLAFVGDIMCGDSFSLMGRGTATMIDRYGVDFLPLEIVEIFKSHDLVMGNVECVLSDAGRNDYSLRRLHMRGRASTAKLLAEWGITVASVANNHIFEQGRAAALDTVGNLRQAGLQVIGAGSESKMNRGSDVLELRLCDKSLCLLGLCLKKEKYAYDGGIDLSQAIEKIQTCQQKADVIIVSVHWGDELIEYPGLQQKQLTRQFKNAGADMVIGHHPHVFQGVDRLDSMLTAYSLGNFIFDSSSTATGWSIILSITVRADNSLAYEAIPFVRSEDFRPQLAVGEQKAALLDEIKRRNQLCRMEIEDEDVFIRRYQQRVRTLCRDSRETLWKNLARRFFKFKPIFWPQLLMRPIQRRMGTW